MYYTGIGSRKAPEKILNIMSEIGNVFKDNYILRSGGAPGADLAFEKHLNYQQCDIFLPWKGFNDHKSTLYNIIDPAFEIAALHHPYWQHLKPSTRKLMARNVHQVLGMMLDRPSDFLICWTPDGATKKEEITKDTGGTGLAIAVADQYHVPVFNLQNESVLDTLVQQYDLKGNI